MAKSKIKTVAKSKPRARAQMSRKASRLVRRFRQAVIDWSWKGSRDPEMFDGIEQEYLDAIEALAAFIAKLENPT